MSTRERASNIFNVLTEQELEIFVYLFGDKHRECTEKVYQGETRIESLSAAFAQLGQSCFMNGREPQHQTVRESLCSYDNSILQLLREEKEAKISGRLYNELQVRMTYNSNHIEGIRITEDQTRLIYETNTIYADKGILVDDILETVHHFQAIDYVIDTAEDILTEDIIKQLHFILKHDTKDSQISWFSVGDYKKRSNVVGGRETVKPKDVPVYMKRIIESYNSKSEVNINDIVDFHAEFEYIHPFQDGNGRVGRLIALKECLHHNIVPFIIEESKKEYYYRGLLEWKREKGWLTDTCLDGQDTFIRLLDMLDISH